jgi:membrane-bound lytic murein transglycosylase D
MGTRIPVVVVSMILLSACGSSEKAATPGWGRSAGEESYEVVVANHKADAYEALARMHRSELSGDEGQTERALQEAMGHVRALTELGVEEADMRELYRSVVTAYEGHYGSSDTLRADFGDVFALRDEMFETLNELDEPLAEDAVVPEVERLGGTIPMISNRLVAQSISFLQKDPDRHVYPWMRRSGTYFPMIEGILREEGVPDELKFLAAIESGLNPRARSRVGAGGLWQFMPATGRAYGLDVSSWVDERSDPEKATRAAARHLSDLYETFDDWLLALAAYNCGPTRVHRAVDRFEEAQRRRATFWDIYQELPRETRNYVPMYIAARTVMTDPASFGLSRVEPGPAYAYDVVEVEGPMDLRAAADLAGTDIEELRALNPELLQSIVPGANYRLRIPPGTARAFNRSYAALPENERGGGYVEHVVSRGESLARIARRYGTSVDALRAYNGISGSVIHPGDRLTVPVRSSPSSGPPVMVASHRGGPSAPERGASSSYTVRSGDSLSRIASMHGMRVSDLRAWNGLSSDRIYPGQHLTVRSAPQAKQWFNYRVQRGDTLTSIAARHGASIAEIRTWNELSSDLLRVGEQLALYGEYAGR